MTAAEQSNSGQADKVIANTADLQRIIHVLQQRASHHRWVGVITVSSAAIVLLAGLVPAVALIRDPFLNVPKTSDISVLVLNSSVRVVGLAIVGYLARLLTSIYRYNTQLWNHYTTRALALELAASGTVPLVSAVTALSTSTVTFGAEGPLLDSVSLSADGH
jgi:hypothetical protein